MSTIYQGLESSFINIIKKGEKEELSERVVNVKMHGKDLERLERLKSRVKPHTNKNVLLNSLKLLDELVNEMDKGSILFIKREGEDMEKLSIFS